MSKVIGVNGRPSQFDDDWNLAISSAANYLTNTAKPIVPSKV